MTTLCKYEREAIVREIIAHKYDARLDELDNEAIALALEIRKFYLGEYLKMVDEAPEGAFKTFPDISIAIDGRWYVFCYSGTNIRRPRAPANWQRMFHRFEKDKYVSNDPKHSAFFARIVACAERTDIIRKEREELEHGTDIAIKGYRTFESLLKAWPDASKFINKVLATTGGSANLPALPFAALSAKLDLPPVAEAA